MISIAHAAVGLLTYVMTMVLHELAHILYFRWGIGRDVDIFIGRGARGWRCHVGTVEDYHSLVPGQKFMIYFWGIIAGVIPLWIVTLEWPLMGLLFVPYLFSCRSDIRNMWRCWRRG